MKKWFRIAIVAAIGLLNPLKSYNQEANPIAENYSSIFGSKYNEACAYVKQNTWISDTLTSYGIDPAFATAIVFPELIRYSAIQNSLETAGLFTLYVQYGQKYANFSVGHFQMKPTFAEQLEKDFQKLRYFQALKFITFNRDDSEKARLERVKRLDSPLWQVRYLSYFIRIMDAKYASAVWASQTEKLRYYATAYNTGYTLPSNTIKQHIHRKSFYTSIVKSTPCYCYADIAEDFYEKLSSCKIPEKGD